jgi:hypothetical protein
MNLPFGVESHAYWSTAPEPGLLLLVHGFGGHPRKTWSSLVTQLLAHQTTAGFDVVLFGYDSVTQTADESANDLHACLDALFANAKVANAGISRYDGSLCRGDGYRYKRAVFVGHSLGACVVRRAVLNQIRSGKDQWKSDIRLAWFAPAHRGAKVFRLIASVALGLGGGSQVGVLSPASYFAPSLTDLGENSSFLTDLLNETEALAPQHPELVAPLTFWAKKDKVVVNRPFARDVTPFTPVPNAGHQNICRPTKPDIRLAELTTLMAAL